MGESFICVKDGGRFLLQKKKRLSIQEKERLNNSELHITRDSWEGQLLYLMEE